MSIIAKWSNQRKWKPFADLISVIHLADDQIMEKYQIGQAPPDLNTLRMFSPNAQIAERFMVVCPLFVFWLVGACCSKKGLERKHSIVKTLVRFDCSFASLLTDWGHDVTVVDDINGVEIWHNIRHILCLSLFVWGIILPYWKLDHEVLLMVHCFLGRLLVGPRSTIRTVKKFSSSK